MVFLHSATKGYTSDFKLYTARAGSICAITITPRAKLSDAEPVSSRNSITQTKPVKKRNFASTPERGLVPESASPIGWAPPFKLLVIFWQKNLPLFAKKINSMFRIAGASALRSVLRSRSSLPASRLVSGRIHATLSSQLTSKHHLKPTSSHPPSLLLAAAACFCSFLFALFALFALLLAGAYGKGDGREWHCSPRLSGRCLVLRQGSARW